MAILLGIAMLLVDFIVLTSVQHTLQDSVQKNGRDILSSIESILADTPSGNLVGVTPQAKREIRRMLRYSDIKCFLITDSSGIPVHGETENCLPETDFKKAVADVVSSGQLRVSFVDTMWSVFWKQPRYVIMVSPIYRNKKLFACAGTVLSMEWIYHRMGQIQKMILIYILINTVILSAIGVFGLSQVTVKPLKRLVKRADEYNYIDETPFISDKETSEFNKLSKSLNRMFNRIADDKIRLETTVSSLENSNKELTRVREEIIRAEKFATVGKLASGIAHEIGNPLGIVIGYLELLQQQNLKSEEAAEYLKRADEEINRINTIIRQLLEFSRTENRHLVPVSVGELLCDVVEVLKVQPLMSDLGFDVTLFSGRDTVIADPEQLRQVFVNVIINAADAVASSGRETDGMIKISTHLTEEAMVPDKTGQMQLIIQFEDNGPGISKTHIENIFDPFYTTKEPGKGTGLGLSVSYRIIEGIGGRMEAISEGGDGTTISICLPLADAESLKNPVQNSSRDTRK